MKKRQIVLYVVVMLVLLTTSVYATISAELGFELTADDNIFYPGEEFILTIGLKDLDAPQGIKSIEGYIDIDENVLEPITVDNIVKDENGKVNIGTNNLEVYDASNISSSSEKGVILNTNPVSERGDYKIVINLENPISADSDLVDVRFKIRSDISAGEYKPVMTYQLFKIFSTDAGEKLELPGVSYSITISDSSGESNIVNTPENNPTNDATENPVNNTPANNAEKPVNNTPSNTPVNNAEKPVNNTAKPVNNTPANNAEKPVNNTAKKPVNNTVKKPANNTVNKVVDKTNGNINGGNGGGTESTSSKKDNTLSPTNLPKTGYRLMLIPIIVMAIVGLVFYKKYSKYNNYHE